MASLHVLLLYLLEVMKTAVSANLKRLHCKWRYRAFGHFNLLCNMNCTIQTTKWA